MTLVSLPSAIYWPGMGTGANAPARANVGSMTSAGLYYAFITVAREDMVVSHVAYAIGTATASPTVTVSIEDLSATGFPSGTPAFGSSASAASSALSGNSFNVIALGASATISKGTAFAVKIAYTSGTAVSAAQMGNLTITSNTQMPYNVLNTGTPTKSAGTSPPMMGLGSSTTTFYQVPGMAPYSTDGTAVTFNNTSSAKRGLVFTIPMNCRAIGMRFHAQSGTGNYNVLLMDNSGNELSSSSTAYDGDYTNGGNGMISAYFDNTVTLSAGTTYRIAVEPSSATNVVITTLPLSSTNYRGGTPIGTSGTYATYTSGGGWDDSATTTVPIMDLIIDQVDNGSGTGGTVGVIGG